MVFGADWDEPLTLKELRGRTYTVEELKILVDSTSEAEAAAASADYEAAFAFALDQLAYGP